MLVSCPSSTSEHGHVHGHVLVTCFCWVGDTRVTFDATLWALYPWLCLRDRLPTAAVFPVKLHILKCLKLFAKTEASRRGTTHVCITCRFGLSLPKFTIVNKIDGDRTLRAPNQPSQPSRGESSNFGDSSGPLFSIYSRAAEEEDNKMAERWQKDADGILFFVSSPYHRSCCLCVNWNTIDRSIFCCSCRTPWRDRPGPQAKQPGYLCILSWKHL